MSPQGLRHNQTIFSEKKGTIWLLFPRLVFLLQTHFTNWSTSPCVFFSRRTVKRRFHARPEESVTIRHLWKLKPDPIYLLQWEPLVGYIQMNLLQQVSLYNLPFSLLSLFSLTRCRSLRLSGTLRKIGYLSLCLAFPQTQSPSISTSPSVSLSLSLCPCLPQWDSYRDLPWILNGSSAVLMRGKLKIRSWHWQEGESRQG